MRPQDMCVDALVESARDAVIVAEANTGRIVLWNETATKIFGYSSSEALELRIDTLVPDRLRARHQVGIARYLDTGLGPYIDSQALLDLPALTKDGEEIRIEMSLTPISPIRNVWAGGRFALAIVRDVTERKRIEEKLRESEETFHALIENALDIIMVTDSDGTIRYISPSVERVLGYRPEEMTGANTADYVHPDDLEKGFSELAEALAKPGVHPVAVETRVRHKDGSWRWLEGIANNLVDHPSVGGVVFNHRDVTDRKQAERELAQRAAELASSNAELERFAYSVSHDLRAPLRAISGFSQVLLEDYANELDEEGKDYLRRVSDAGLHMGQLIDALLAISRVTRAEMQREAVGLSDLVESIAKGL